METWAVIVLNWNGAVRTTRCADAVNLAASRCAKIRYKKLFVDNGSTPDDAAILGSYAERNADWRILRVTANLGFAKGMNVGILHPDQSNVDKFVLLNNDVEVDPDFFCALSSHFYANPDQAITGVTIFEEATSSLQCYGGYTYNNWLGYARPNQDPQLVPDYISGAVMVVKGAFLQRIRGIPTDNFLYFEELNLKRHMAVGETQGVCLEAKSTHIGGWTVANVPKAPNPHYYAALACFRYSAATNPKYLPTVIAARLTGLLIRSLWSRDFTALSGAWRAVLDFFTSSKQHKR